MKKYLNVSCSDRNRTCASAAVIEKDCREWKPVWHFLDLKAYCIMAVMMGGGIWLRSSGLVPDVFIAVFYTGLSCALALAGVLFWIVFLFCRDDKMVTKTDSRK